MDASAGISLQEVTELVKSGGNVGTLVLVYVVWRVGQATRGLVKSVGDFMEHTTTQLEEIKAGVGLVVKGQAEIREALLDETRTRISEETRQRVRRHGGA